MAPKWRLYDYKEEMQRKRVEFVDRASEMVDRIVEGGPDTLEFQVMSSISKAISDLKTLLSKQEDAVEKMKIFKTFKFINDVYFDNLEEDINTKH